MSFFKEFKEFINQGDVMDMAVGVIIGGALTAIVTALTSDIIQPLINFVTGGNAEVGGLVIPGTGIDFGSFISACINFLIIAFIVFCLVKGVNKMRSVGKKKEDVRIVTSGAGAAAIAIVKLLLSSGFRNVTMCDRKGAIYAGRDGLNWIKEEMAQVTNLDKKAGSLADMLVGADVFIGVSAPGMVTKEMVQTMNKDAIIFACANPTPEIFPDEAKAGGARVVSTGRSDYPNQINNVLAFPGIFRGAFDVRASDINEEMKIAASNALANLISDEELNENYIIPAAFDPRVGPAVAKAVAEAARKSGVARL